MIMVQTRSDLQRGSGGEGEYRGHVWSKFGTNVSSWREALIKTRTCFQHFTLNRSSTDRPKEAEKYYRKALTIKPDSADANINLAHLLRVTNRLREADQQYNKARSLRPGDPQLYFQHGVVLEKLERRKVCYLLLLFLWFQSQGCTTWGAFIQENYFRASLQS